jgi:hypothetical protein
MCSIFALHPTFFNEGPIRPPPRLQTYLSGVAAFLFFGFFHRLLWNWNPVRGHAHFNGRRAVDFPSRLEQYFHAPFYARPPQTGKKNIIMISLDSFELEAIGRYNPRYVFGTPFLTNLTQFSTFAIEVPWNTMAPPGDPGFFTAFCGMPVNQNPKHVIAAFSKPNARLYCLGDLLLEAGYTLASMQSGNPGRSGLNELLAAHNYKPKAFKNDAELFGELSSSKVKELAGSQPFGLFISASDSRAPGRVGCKKPRDYLYNNMAAYRSFDCLDQFLEKFFAELRANGLNEVNTRVVMFSDAIREDLSKSGTFSKRKVWVAYPFGPKQYISEKSSFYDIVPTLMDFADIKYSPVNPFGGKVTEAPNPVPTQKEYDAFYQRFGK